MLVAHPMHLAGPMKRAELRVYGWIYGVGCTVVLLASIAGVAGGVWFGNGPVVVATLVPLALLGVAAVRRVHELRRYADVPGPPPSFFLGNLESLLVHRHGARDRALVELHEEYGPVVKVHMAWGSTPFVSLSVVSGELRNKDMDSNRKADRTVLPQSSMGLARGDQHTAHKRQMTPHFARDAVVQKASRLDEVSSTYLEAWRSGTTRHGSLKADLHHWSAHSLGYFLCGPDWERGTDLSTYLAAIAELEEAISFRAFHPFFVRWLFVGRAARARAAYRRLFGDLERVMERRSGRSDQPIERPTEMFDVLGTLVGLESEATSGDPRWSHHECVEELISLVAGGTDAMSYTLGQALYLLSRNPEVQTEAQRRLLADEPTTQRAGDRFVLHILHETMRLFPAVPFSSKISERRAIEVLGISIPARTNVMWMKTAVGQNEAVFADATRFDPSRFEVKSDGTRPVTTIASAMPFGAGLRHCVGRHLAEYLCTRFLSNLLRQFELAPIDERNLRFSATVSVTPSSVPVQLVPRADLPRRNPFQHVAPAVELDRALGDGFNSVIDATG
jgi:cytochrome P450